MKPGGFFQWSVNQILNIKAIGYDYKSWIAIEDEEGKIETKEEWTDEVRKH